MPYNTIEEEVSFPLAMPMPLHMCMVIPTVSAFIEDTSYPTEKKNALPKLQVHIQVRGRVPRKQNIW